MWHNERYLFEIGCFTYIKSAFEYYVIICYEMCFVYSSVLFQFFLPYFYCQSYIGAFIILYLYKLHTSQFWDVLNMIYTLKILKYICISKYVIRAEQ